MNSDAGSAPRLTVHSVTRRLGGREIVSDVSITVSAGQISCLLGPSGCGKSTTLRIIAGLDRQDSGLVAIGGVPVSDDRIHTPPENRSVGMMFQDFALFPFLTVGDNVAFGLKGSRRESAARVSELLSKVAMESFRGKYPHELSGGEQQRAALARALAPRPGILLMDEPFSSLDHRLRDGIRDETIAVLKEEKTAVLLVTHEPQEAMRMGDEILLMRDGRIIQRGGPYAMYNNPVDREAASFFSEINLIHGKVNNSLVQTPFGQFFAPGYTDGTEVEIIIRPQHFRIDFDRNGSGPNPTPQDGVPARGIVERVRFIGDSSLVELRMDFDRSVLKAAVPAVFMPRKGTPFWLSMRRDRCYVFPRTGHGRVHDPLSSAYPFFNSAN
ncbi:MAG: ABC transporter ATP-binding protein [Albidovulum sp.]|nr:ABC transporter ATP-binding protein [Albidovulum sp.]